MEEVVVTASLVASSVVVLNGLRQVQSWVLAHAAPPSYVATAAGLRRRSRKKTRGCAMRLVPTRLALAFLWFHFICG